MVLQHILANLRKVPTYYKNIETKTYHPVLTLLLSRRWLKLYDTHSHVLSSVKRIATQILVIAKSNGRKNLILRGCVSDMILPSKPSPIQN